MMRGVITVFVLCAGFTIALMADPAYPWQNVLYVLRPLSLAQSQRIELDIKSVLLSKGISDVVFIMDKDGTLSKPNEHVSDSMINLIRKIFDTYDCSHIVICTGGILEDSEDNLINPLEKMVKLNSHSWFKRLTYFFMAGLGKISWDEQGRRTIEYFGEPFSKDDQMFIVRNLAKALMQNIEGIRLPEGTDEAKNMKNLSKIFDEFIAKNRKLIGHIEISNGKGRQFTIELKKSSEKQALPGLQNSDFTRKVSETFKGLLAERANLKNLHIKYGDTYVDCSPVDKKDAVECFLGERNFKNPLIIAIGDGSNDYGFLSKTTNDKTKLSFFVGKDCEGMPDGVTLWQTPGPAGTEEILVSIVKSVETVFEMENNIRTCA
jgi:hydroxymethylpyrimidine pyrophosphatase-like HAD family hydrolase